MKRTCGFNLFNKKETGLMFTKRNKGKNAIIRAIMLEALKNKAVCPRRDDYILIDGEKYIPINLYKNSFGIIETNLIRYEKQHLINAYMRIKSIVREGQAPEEVLREFLD